MRKWGLNDIMFFLLITGGIIFLISQILKIPISNMELNLIFILLFFIIIAIHGYKTLGVRDLFIFFLISTLIPLFYEYTDGLGFGKLVNCTCSYSNVLGPTFYDKVPYAIPLVWSISLYGAFTMTNIIFKRIRTKSSFEEEASFSWLVKIIGMGFVMGFIMASLDLIIDPVMIAMGAWSWSVEGPYFGIPLWNYEGWIEISTVTFVCFSIYLLIMKKSQIFIDGEKQSRYTLFVVILYLASFIVYALYAVEVQVTSVILWAMFSMGFFASITIIQFFRSYQKIGKQFVFEYKDT